MTDTSIAQRDFAEGVRLLNGGRIDSALEPLKSAYENYPSPQTLKTYASALMLKGDYARALECFERMDKERWHTPRTFAQRGEAYERISQFDDAIGAYKCSIESNPVFSPALRRYCDLMWSKDRKEVINRLDRADAQITVDTPDCIETLKHVATYHELAARLNQGLSDLFGATLDDLSFTHAIPQRDRAIAIAEELLELQPDHRGATSLLASHCLREHRWSEVSHYLRSVEQAERHHAEYMVWLDAPRAARLNSLTDEDLFSAFAPCETILRLPPSEDGTLFLSSTIDYFAHFTAPLLLSLNEIGARSRVLIHLIDPVPADVNTARAFAEGLTGLTVGLTAERLPKPLTPQVPIRTYAHAIRYIRAYAAHASGLGPICVADVDALANKNPKAVFDYVGSADLGLCAVPGMWRTNSHFRAALTVFTQTKHAHHFLRRVAAYIADAYQRDEMFWGLDQNALYVVYDEMLREGFDLEIACLGEALMSLNNDPLAVFWGESGKEKFELVRRLNKGETNLSEFDRPYDRSYIRYFLQARDSFRTLASAASRPGE